MMFAAIDTPAPARSLAADKADIYYNGVGILLVSVLPALFWTAVAAEAGQVFGASFTMSGLAGLCTAIAVFLAAVCTPLMARA